MPSKQDCQQAVVGGQINDGTLAHYQAYGATSNDFNTAENEFLIANGATPGHNHDMWYELLVPLLGYSAALPDMLADFWCNYGGVFTPPDPPLFDGTIPPLNTLNFQNNNNVYDASPNFGTGGFVNQYSLINAPPFMTITNRGVIRVALDESAAAAAGYTNIQVQGNNITGPAATSNAFTLTVDANAPTWNSVIIPDLTAEEGTPVNQSGQSAQIWFNGGPVSTFALVDNPPWLTIDPVTGVWSGTPVLGQDAAATYVTATNADGTAQTNTFAVTVTNVVTAPVYTGVPIPDITGNTGVAITPYNVATGGHFSGDAVNLYYLTGHPSWMTITPAGLIEGTPDVSGITTGIRVWAQNGGGQTPTDTFQSDISAGGILPLFSRDYATDLSLGANATFGRDSEATYYDASGVLQTASLDVPRFTHDPVTLASLGLLMETAATNVITDSENGSYNTMSRVTVTNFYADSPIASANAQRLVCNETNASVSVQDRNLNFGIGDSVNSAFVKRVVGQWLMIRNSSIGGQGDIEVSFDLVNGVVGTSTNGTGKIEQIGTDGWYRISVAQTVSLDGTGHWGFVFCTADNTPGGTLNDEYLIDGRQLEQGSLVATSYIPTSGTAVSRAADTLSYSGVPSGNDEETRAIVDGFSVDLDNWDGVVDDSILLTGNGRISEIKVYNDGQRPIEAGPTDYDMISRNNFTETGTFQLAAYLGTTNDVVTTWASSIFYRKRGTVPWTALEVDGTAIIDEVGEWEFGNDWNKSGNNCLTISFMDITAINACTYIYFNEATLGATVGNNFLFQAWSNCTNLTSMPSGFNLPSGITSVGNDFLRQTWSDCTSLTSMPSGFNLPSGITSVGNEFLYLAWDGCISLTSMPSGFNLPLGITSLGNNFIGIAWRNCISLTFMPSGFNLPSGITSVGSFFLYQTWNGCSNLASMPSGFNLPSGITSVGSDFLRQAWLGCINLSSMPFGFNLPSGITSVGSNFLFQSWFSCTSLNNDGTTEDLDFPTSDYAATGVFGGSCPITPDSVTGPFPQAVAVNRS